jgi:hypothetical protein
MAIGLLNSTAKPVNQGVAVSALKVATAAVDAAQDSTAKLLAMRKEFERLRAEHDRARDRADDLEREAKALRVALSRTNQAPGNLRRRGRWLVKSLALLVTAFVATGSGAARAAPATDAIYVCTVGDKPPMYLNLTRHRFRFADQAGVLNEGLFFNFTTTRGYTVVLDIGDPDRLHFNRPRVVSGTATVSKDGRQGTPQTATCSQSGPAMAKRKIPAKSAGEVEALRRQYDDADGWCRGGSGAASDRGCARRDRVSKQLEARGQCYAREINETGGHNEVWRACP